jgi:hypothetical protein
VDSLKERVNGERYLLVGETRQRYFVGINSKSGKVPENAPTPTTLAPHCVRCSAGVAPMFLGGWLHAVLGMVLEDDILSKDTTSSTGLCSPES